jgi:hypothetical protein
MEALLILLHRKLEGQPHTYLCMELHLAPTSAGQYQLNHTSLRTGTVTRPTRNNKHHAAPLTDRFDMINQVPCASVVTAPSDAHLWTLKICLLSGKV